MERKIEGLKRKQRIKRKKTKLREMTEEVRREE